MREITRIMVKKYMLNKLKLDMMGAGYGNINQLTFHHLLIARRHCKKEGLGDGYLEWNGAIIQTDFHNLFHTIENRDDELFYRITSEIQDMKIKERLDKENLLAIHDMLDYFIKEYRGERSSKGNLLIKPQIIQMKKQGLERIRDL